MKTFSKNLLPELHLNPINRDLVVVGLSSLLIAMTIVTIGMMFFSQM
jgi:hypothetical protein